MGMFDTIYCQYPLPDAQHQDLEFQTKDLECLLHTYTITRDGRLVLKVRRRGEETDREIEWPLHGDLRIYTSVRTAEDSEWVEYVVRFTQDRVEWIRPLNEMPPEPEIPPMEWNPQPFEELLGILKTRAERGGFTLQNRETEITDAAASPPEAALLLSLRRDRQDLESLLERCSDHWGYEDPVYRFYHQSFKMFGLQDQTRSIVERLQALAPDLPLNPRFVQIIESGTGKAFKLEDNEHWPEVTRPIVEAFFHARFFLEMAVRYADLQAPPQPLPSGYAALLYLFRIR
jgi:hypothetical protein